MQIVSQFFQLQDSRPTLLDIAAVPTILAIHHPTHETNPMRYQIPPKWIVVFISLILLSYHQSSSQLCNSDAPMRPIQLSPDLSLLAGDSISLKLPLNGTALFLQPKLDSDVVFSECSPIPLISTPIESSFTQFIIIPVAVFDQTTQYLASTTSPTFNPNSTRTQTTQTQAYNPDNTTPVLTSTVQLVHVVSGRLLGTTRCPASNSLPNSSPSNSNTDTTNHLRAASSLLPCTPHQPMLLPSSFDSHCEYRLDDFETVFDLDNHVIPTPQQTADLSNAYSVQYLDQSTTSSLLSTSNTTILNAWAQVSDQPQGSQDSSSQNSQQSTSGDFSHQSDRSQVWQNYQPSQDVSSNSKRPDTLPSNFKYYNVGDTVTTGTGFVPLSTSHRRSDSSVTDEGGDVVSSNSDQDNTKHATAAYSFDDSIPAHQNYLHYQQAHQKARLRKEMNIDDQQNRSSDRTSNQNEVSESSGVQYIRQTGPFYTPSSLWQRVQQEFTTLTTSFFAHTKQNNHTNNNFNNREVRIREDRKNTNAPTQTDSSSSTLPLHNATMNTFKNIDIGGYVGNFQSGSGLFTDILNGNMSSIPGLSTSKDTPLSGISNMATDQMSAIFSSTDPLAQLAANSPLTPQQRKLDLANQAMKSQATNKQLEHIYTSSPLLKDYLSRYSSFKPSTTSPSSPSSTSPPGSSDPYQAQSFSTTTSNSASSRTTIAFISLRTRPISSITDDTKALVTPCRGYVRNNPAFSQPNWFDIDKQRRTSLDKTVSPFSLSSQAKTAKNKPSNYENNRALDDDDDDLDGTQSDSKHRENEQREKQSTTPKTKLSMFQDFQRRKAVLEEQHRRDIMEKPMNRRALISPELIRHPFDIPSHAVSQEQQQQQQQRKFNPANHANQHKPPSAFFSTLSHPTVKQFNPYDELDQSAEIAQGVAHSPPFNPYSFPAPPNNPQRRLLSINDRQNLPKVLPTSISGQVRWENLFITPTSSLSSANRAGEAPLNVQRDFERTSKMNAMGNGNTDNKFVPQTQAGKLRNRLSTSKLSFSLPSKNQLPSPSQMNHHQQLKTDESQSVDLKLPTILDKHVVSHSYSISKKKTFVSNDFMDIDALNGHELDFSFHQKMLDQKNKLNQPAPHARTWSEQRDPGQILQKGVRGGHDESDSDHFDLDSDQSDNTVFNTSKMGIFQTATDTDQGRIDQLDDSTATIEERPLLQSCTLSIDPKTLLPTCIVSYRTYPQQYSVVAMLNQAKNSTTDSSGPEIHVDSSTPPHTDSSDETTQSIEAIPIWGLSRTLISTRPKPFIPHQSPSNTPPSDSSAQPVSPFTLGERKAEKTFQNSAYPSQTQTSSSKHHRSHSTRQGKPENDQDEINHASPHNFSSFASNPRFTTSSFSTDPLSTGYIQDQLLQLPQLAGQQNGGNFWISEGMSSINYDMDYASINTTPYVIAQQVIRNYGPFEQYISTRGAKRIFLGNLFRVDVGFIPIFVLVFNGFPGISISPLANILNAILEPIYLLTSNSNIPWINTIGPINNRTGIDIEQVNVAIPFDWAISHVTTEDHEVVSAFTVSCPIGMNLIARSIAHLGRSSVPFTMDVTRSVFVPAGVYGTTQGGLIQYDYRVPGVYDGANLSNLEYLADPI